MITFGRPSDFAIKVLPLRGGPAEPDPAARATWVSLELHVSGKNLTAHTHEDSHTFHAGIHWPAIYLARWLVRSWPGLFESARWPIATHKTNARDVALELDQRCVAALDDDDDDAVDDVLGRRDEFVSQHSLLAAAAGAVVPGVYLARDGRRVSIAWDSPHMGDVSFHRQWGEEFIDAHAFLPVVRNFVDWTAGVLERAGETMDRAELGAWLKRLDTQEQAQDVLLGYAGLDRARWNAVQPPGGAMTVEAFFDLAPTWAARGADADPTDSPVAIAFRCCSPELARDDLLAIRTLIREAPAHPDAMNRLDDMARRITKPVGRMRDYDQGYELASQVRRLRQNELDMFDVEALLGELHVPVRDIELGDPDLDGGSICDAAHGPIVFVNRRSLKASAPWGRRMVLAHELCHLLFDREQAIALAIVSGPWAPATLERRANAFAAELLLPRAAMERALGRRPSAWSDDELQKLMRDYKVGITMCTWHMRNRAWDDND